MSKKRVQKGDIIDYTNAGAAIASGDPVVIGAMVGVAQVDIASGAVGAVAISKVQNLPKLDAAVITAGMLVGFDISAGANGEVDDDAMVTAAGDITEFGVAFEDKAVTVGEDVAVLLTPGTGTIN